MQNPILQTMMNCLKLLSVILAGLWFAACAHTSAPEATKPRQEKAKQTTTESSAAQEAPEKPPADQAASRETATDKQKQATGKSPSSREASQKTARDEQKQASEKTPTGQAASQETDKDAQKQAADKADSSQAAAGTAKTPDTKTAQEGSAGAAGTQSKATEKSTSSRRAGTPETADSKLAEARRNLRISEATEKRIAAELEQLKKSGAASPETIKNYETYHESVQGMVAENRKIVAQMEAAKARHSAGGWWLKTAKSWPKWRPPKPGILPGKNHPKRPPAVNWTICSIPQYPRPKPQMRWRLWTGS